MNRGWAALRDINWRREVIFPALAVAETSLIAPWMLAFLSNIGSFQPERAAGVCLALILGMLYLARAMNALRVHVLIQRFIVLLGIIGLGVGVLYLVVSNSPRWVDWAWLREPLQHSSALINLLPGAIVVMLSVIWLCWRGLRLATHPLSVMDMVVGFQVGILVLAMFTLVSIARDAIIFIPVFFFSQLLAMGLTRVETIPHMSGKRSPFGGWWLGMLVGSTGTLVLLAGATSMAVLGIGPERLWRALAPVLAIITLPVALILLPIASLLAGVASIVASALASIAAQLTLLFDQVQAWATALARFGPPPFLSALRYVVIYGPLILLVLLALAALIGVVRMVGRWAASRESQDDEEHESIWSSQALLKKLAAQLQRQLARLKSLASIAAQFGASGLFAALTIRRIYAQTVKLAASRGYPRPASHTPYEHLATLQQAVPGCEAELAQITEAYVGVHYGELPERPDALAEIRAAFERVRERAADSAGKTRDRAAI